MEIRLVETIKNMALDEEVARVVTPLLRRFHMPMILRFILGLFWCLLHLAVSIVHIGSSLIQVLLCSVISTGLVGKYQNLQLHKLRYLAIVVDSDEAKDTRRIIQLLHWLSAIGVKYVILYDMEGVMKKSVEIDTSCSDADVKAGISLLYEGRMKMEVLSFSDNKMAVAKAATFLCSKHLKSDTAGSNTIEPEFTEADVANALKAVGCGGPDPDLLLVYGPARCHLGFPAWRMRYTEIVHMGSLKFMKYGAIVKAIYDFSKKRQNYGS